MRSLQVLVLLSSICVGVAAQTPAPAAAAAPAAVAQEASGATAKWETLQKEFMTRIRAIKREDTAGRDAAIKERVTQLEAFAKEFPKTAEATKAYMEIANAAARAKNEPAVKAALANVDLQHLDMGAAVGMAKLAKDVKLATESKLFLDHATAKAKTPDERLELASRIGGQMGDKDAYAAALGEIAKQFPDTKAGKTAASKLAAANLKVGSDPIAFTTKDMDGKDVSPADYKGKVLLIDFWATWCGPCMQELPHVLETYNELHGQGFEILGVSLDRENAKEKLVSTIKDRGMSWRHVFDGKFWEAEIAQLHDIQSIPATILIGKDGKIAGMNLRGDALKTAVKAALEAK